MIFAFGEDGTLELFADLGEVRVHCEGIDVESGVWDFYDENGEPLLPVFRTPSRIRTYLFGLFSSVTSSQDFSFKPAADATEPSLLQCLSPSVVLAPNSRFSSIDEVRSYLEGRSRGP